MEVKITALITKTRARLYEVPIFHYGRAYEEARKSRRVMVSGLFGILYTIISWRLMLSFDVNISVRPTPFGIVKRPCGRCEPDRLRRRHLSGGKHSI